MSNEEANSLYKCTVREYHALHKWDTGGAPALRWVWMDRATTTTGSSVVSPSSAGVDVDMTGDRTSVLTDSNFPHMPPRVFQKAIASALSRMVY